MANTDSLTDLDNRNAIQDKIRTEIESEAPKRVGRRDYSRISTTSRRSYDHIGHVFGDRLIRDVSEPSRHLP